MGMGYRAALNNEQYEIANQPMKQAVKILTQRYKSWKGNAIRYALGRW